MSTLHRSCSFGPPAKLIPETVRFYNHSKYGVDIFDSMVRKYTTKAGSRRWPMHVFYNLLDMAGINSWILYQKATDSAISRRRFLLKLGEELCEIFASSSRLERTASLSLATAASSPSMKRKECQIGAHTNKTSFKCSQCTKWCCGTCAASKHVTILCKNCAWWKTISMLRSPLFFYIRHVQTFKKSGVSFSQFRNAWVLHKSRIRSR